MTTLKHIIPLVALSCITHFGYCQDGHLSSRKGKSSLGVGIGLPYGAIGIRAGTNLIEGLNLFGGLGYQIAGIGYNVGLRKDFPSSNATQFYMTGMYGTNAATKVKGLSEYNRVYTGATFGGGVKINSWGVEGNYWDLGLLIPIRSSEFRDAEQAMKNDPRVSDLSTAWPVLIVVGYNFTIQ
ncbi:hypothetical protein [Tunicatimonas pelagia]|uniref:hypothetical protein n=1 Tax=Tunicatimonas pelagia TaxID=931531 RepID=UPI002665051A|nr:hypothetical protein [Tunicatimonas pelagia]WKN40424.1 hypothetical protein P0M28_15375 [Tunicatimonas pelagia]